MMPGFGLLDHQTMTHRQLDLAQEDLRRERREVCQLLGVRDSRQVRGLILQNRLERHGRMLRQHGLDPPRRQKLRVHHKLQVGAGHKLQVHHPKGHGVHHLRGCRHTQRGASNIILEVHGVHHLRGWIRIGHHIGVLLPKAIGHRETMECHLQTTGSLVQAHMAHLLIAGRHLCGILSPSAGIIRIPDLPSRGGRRRQQA